MTFLEERFVLVAGVVKDPQAVPIPDQLTALDAVMMAGGPIHSDAALKNVVVARVIDGKRVGFRTDLSAAFRGEPHDPVYLRPNDLVFVPRTRIVKLGQWIEQHVNRMLPFLSVSKRTDSVTVTYDSTVQRL